MRAARIAALCTSSIGTPSYRLRLRLEQDRLRADIGAEVLRRPRHDQRLQPRPVERHALAAIGDVQRGLGRRRRAPGPARAALLRAALAVQHVGARHFMMAAAHQAEFDLVLHILDVEGAAARTRAQQRAHHRLGQAVDRLAHAGRCRALRAVHGQEGLHQRDRDLVRLEGDHRAVAADDLVALVGGVAAGGGSGLAAADRQRCRGGARVVDLHGRVGSSEGRMKRALDERSNGVAGGTVCGDEARRWRARLDRRCARQALPEGLHGSGLARSGTSQGHTISRARRRSSTIASVFGRSGDTPAQALATAA